MTDRKPGIPGRWKANITAEELEKMNAGQDFNIVLTRNDEPVTPGTPYNKAAVLPDDLAQKLCPGALDPAPRDAFEALYNIANGAKSTADAADGKTAAAQTAANNATSRTWTCSLTTNWGGSAAAGYTQTVSGLQGMTSSVRLAGYLIPVISGSANITTKRNIRNAVSKISEIVSGASSVTFICYDEKPATAVSVIVTEVR